MRIATTVIGQVVVPADRYFVLGDNRDMSLDSCYRGFIERSDTIGTPRFVYLSVAPGQDAIIDKNNMAIGLVRWSRIVRMLP